MRIVGSGFLARHLEPIAPAHPGFTVLAAGVSCAERTSPAAFAREEALLAEVAGQCRADGSRLVFFSTASAGMYGSPGCAGREDDPPSPTSPYGSHKYRLEQQLAASGTDHLILRLGHVVGPGQPDHQLLPALIRQVEAGRVRVYRGAARDLIGVADLVVLIGLLMERAGARETVNVASGVAAPVDHILDHIETRLGKTAVREYVTAPSAHRISVAKLRALVPEVDSMGFSPDYYHAVLDTYVFPTRPRAGTKR